MLGEDFGVASAVVMMVGYLIVALKEFWRSSY